MVVAIIAKDLDTVVLGSGPGGYEAAVRASQKGQKVAIIERYDKLGGVCLNVGCIPTKALIEASHAYSAARDGREDMGISAEGVDLDFNKLQEWKQTKVVDRMTGGVEYLMKKNNVEVIHGVAYINDTNKLTVADKEGNHQLYNFKNLILATGSRPIEIKGFKFQGRVIDSTGALALSELPKDLVIIGGGVIGSELGQAFANFGTHVTILEGSPQILPIFEKDAVRVVEKSMKAEGMDIVTNAMAERAEQDEDSVTVYYKANGEEKSVKADYCLVAVGRRPNTDEIGLQAIGVKMNERGLIEVDEQGQTNIPHIYAIGDIVPGAALAHKASYEGIVAAEAISGLASAVDYRSMPGVAYTSPEISSYGLTEAQAKEKGIDAHSFKFPFSANGRAVTMGKQDGFIRLVATKGDNILLGGQMVGPNASEILAEVGQAIETGATAEDIALIIHGHPTLNEVVKDAAEGLLGEPINI